MKPVATDPSYHLNPAGIMVPPRPVVHHDEEYDPAAFELLRLMQERHFWYQGRHRFLLHALRSCLPQLPEANEGLKAIDLGGGCGGWVSYLEQRLPNTFAELALSDSSLQALELAKGVVGERVPRYHIDLLDLAWENRWDMAFLLDVLEHIPRDLDALCQIRNALRPGGLLFVTTPALRQFWSYNDELAHHQRRYARHDFVRLTEAAGMQLRLARYFMFFLSPLLWLSRLKHPDFKHMSPEQVRDFCHRTHRVPPAPLNACLRLVFAAETPLGLTLPFPWGTSILAVLQKPL